MKEFKFYQEIMEEGRLEGELRTRRKAIIEVLEVRFGSKAAAQFQKALNAIEDRHQLSHLHRLAVGSLSLADFRESFASIATAD